MHDPSRRDINRLAGDAARFLRRQISRHAGDLARVEHPTLGNHREEELLDDVLFFQAMDGGESRQLVLDEWRVDQVGADGVDGDAIGSLMWTLYDCRTTIPSDTSRIVTLRIVTFETL
jgi:hypothetical protein